jgi:DNA-binding NarL/FixJ family response regulator
MAGQGGELSAFLIPTAYRPPAPERTGRLLWRNERTVPLRNLCEFGVLERPDRDFWHQQKGERGSLANSKTRILIVDDYEPWRRFSSSTLQKHLEYQVIGEVSEGLEAVQQAQELRPDLILLDIGLPTLNGIEAARRIQKVSPTSKIVFVTENRSVDVAKAALSTGAGGYVVKSNAGSELLPAVRAVLEDKRFVSASLADLVKAPEDDPPSIGHRHEVSFCADDGSLVDGYARFIEAALKNGNAIIVVVTEAHRSHLLSRLEADGVNVPAAIEQGSYIPWDASDALSSLTVGDTLDPVRCAKVIGGLIVAAARSVKGEYGRVVACGEIAPTLLAMGNAEGAIRLEHLWDEITRGYGVHTLCGYLSSAFSDKGSSPILEHICAAHSAVHGLQS